MFALIALICFVVSPFVEAIGPWPLVTLGLSFVALHLMVGWGIPWGRMRGNP